MHQMWYCWETCLYLKAHSYDYKGFPSSIGDTKLVFDYNLYSEFSMFGDQ